MTLDATTIAIAVGGFVQPYVQEFLIRQRLSGRSAVLATAAIAFFIALLATYVVGGFARISIPAFSLLDPSPLLAYLWPKFASVFTLSQLVFGGTQGTKVAPQIVVGTT